MTTAHTQLSLFDPKSMELCVYLVSPEVVKSLEEQQTLSDLAQRAAMLYRFILLAVAVGLATCFAWGVLVRLAGMDQ
jgi:hypothetical protein